MFWRLEHRAFTAGKGAGNRRALKRLVSGGARPGVIAYAGGEPVGWCAVAPRSAYPRLARSRVLAPPDDSPVWSVSCLFVRRDHRRRGLSRRLIDAAAKFAASAGARIVEAYPVDARGPQADAFVWTGVASAFARAGFREVARRSPTRPIMRRTVKGAGAARRAAPPARTG